jgi:PatG C-terminal
VSADVEEVQVAEFMPEGPEDPPVPEGADPPAVPPVPVDAGLGSPDPAAGSAAPRFVYALGQIEARFIGDSVQREYAQAVGRMDTTGLADQEAMHAVLSERENRYLVRKACWVLTVERLDTYGLMPADPGDFDLLIDALRPNPQPGDLDAVIGVLGPFGPPDACGGSMLPVVVFDQLYSFDRDALLKAIPRPKEIAAKEFTAAADELLTRIMQLADNAGATDDHRALNYLVLRYPAIYETAATCHAQELSLTGVDTRPSRLSGARNIIDVVFSYTGRRTDVTEKYFVRVDVTEQFPFLVSKLAPYFDR